MPVRQRIALFSLESVTTTRLRRPRRAARLSRASCPPHLTATFVTIATRPSYRVRRGELIALICPTG